jgi:uncharacterized protein (TIRG00374 family)
MKRAWGQALSLLLSLIVVVYAVIWLDWTALTEMWREVRWQWLILAWGVFLVNYALRAWRIRLLLPASGLTFRQLWYVNSLYGMFNYLLPAKSGEFVLLALLNRRLRIPLPLSAVTVAAARFFDFVVVVLLMPLILAGLWARLPAGVVYSALAFCALTLLAVGAAVLWIRMSGTKLEDGGRFEGESSGWREKFRCGLAQMRTGVIEIFARGNALRVMALTAGIWLCITGNYYLIILSLGLQTSLPLVVALSLLMIPATLLPVQGLANLGTHELGWVSAFMLFGYSYDYAFKIAVGSHAALLFFVLLLGGLGALAGWSEEK